ncbi:MAG: hypothetical protein AB7O52_03125 [Planctomycetota bacterium]
MHLPRRTRFLVLALLTVAWTTVTGQPVVSWQVVDDPSGGQHDELTRVRIGPDGSVFLAGVVADPVELDGFALIRHSPSGQLLWSVSYQGPGSTIDRVSDLAVTASGAYIVGESTSLTSRSLVTRVHDFDGQLAWSAEFPVSAPRLGYRNAAIAVASDGSVTVAATEAGDIRVLRYDGSGVMSWTAVYDGPNAGEDGLYTMKTDSTGSVLINGIVGLSSNGTFIAKYSPTGQFQWEHQILGAFGGIVSPSHMTIGVGDRVIATSGHETPCGLFEYRTVQIASDGTLEWEVDYHGPAVCDSSDPRGNVTAPDGTVVVTGSGVTGETTGFSDIVTVAYDAAGGTAWVRRLDLPGAVVDRANAIALGSEGTNDWAVYLTGSSVSGIALDSVLARYEPDGTLAWTVDLVAPGGFLYYGDLLAVRGRRIVVASTVVDGGDQDYFTQVFDLAPQFVRADCNTDSAVDVADAIHALTALFGAGGAPGCTDACDANDDGHFDLGDPISTLGLLFSAGAPPPPPFPGCDSDPTPDSLDCAASAGC